MTRMRMHLLTNDEAMRAWRDFCHRAHATDRGGPPIEGWDFLDNAILRSLHRPVFEQITKFELAHVRLEDLRLLLPKDGWRKPEALDGEVIYGIRVRLVEGLTWPMLGTELTAHL